MSFTILAISFLYNSPARASIPGLALFLWLICSLQTWIGFQILILVSTSFFSVIFAQAPVVTERSVRYTTFDIKISGVLSLRRLWKRGSFVTLICQRFDVAHLTSVLPLQLVTFSYSLCRAFMSPMMIVLSSVVLFMIFSTSSVSSFVARRDIYSTITCISLRLIVMIWYLSWHILLTTL